jgi:Tfp pilus assembly protein PilO
MPLKRTYRIFFITLASALMSVFVFLFVFNMINNKNKHSVSVLTEIKSKNEQKDNIANLKKTVDETKEKEIVLSSYLVHSNNLDEFINFLEKEGDSISVPIEVLSVNAPNDTKNRLKVELKGTGTFEHVVRFIELIQNAPYQIKINYAYINKVIEPSPVDGKPTTLVRQSGTVFEARLSFDVVSTE